MRGDAATTTHRTGATLGGCLTMAVLALCGGMAEYAVALVSVQVAQLLTLLLVVPGLVALSAPVSLLRGRSGGPLPRVQLTPRRERLVWERRAATPSATAPR